MQNIIEKDFKIIIAAHTIRFRDTVASKLRMEGFSVESAEGGFHLLHLLEKSSAYSLIILHHDH